MQTPTPSASGGSSFEEDTSSRERRVSRRDQLWFFAGVVLLFSGLDWMVLRTFPLAAFGVRLLWSTALVVTGFLLTRPSPRTFHIAICSAGGISALALGAIVHLTGGLQAPLYPWQSILPILAVIVTQDYVRGVVVTSVCSFISVLGVTLLAGAPPLQWAISSTMVFGSSLVGLLFAFTYQRQQRARAEALAKLQESERLRHRADRLAMVGRLAAGVAHEVNNPLAFLKANINYLLEETPTRVLPAEEMKQLLSECQEGVTRIEQIVLELRTFAQKDNDADVSCAIPEVVRDALDFAALKGHAAEVRIEIPDRLPEVRFAHPQLLRVVTHLLTNAVDAMSKQDGPKAPLVRLSAENRDGMLYLRCEDNGPGVPPELTDKIFEPFYTTKPPGRGTGLGLAICREIVERQGGTITARAGLEGGACFELRLPAAPPRIQRSVD